ncbi:bifunctional phosphoribosyl-AMP cyclohydrolase/phosphoribosyl-ATP diphosphatase HisIE [Bacillus sp. N1-1]|jgi:phosphoribosyl-AMP cyclohydrolase / phosphoribosyl-ATP pyrophosphohydrolase|uniref:bifunctional phosphoribosyl-AMP cyclohydrolase/phosphoribosyl-ATP diphosphatase HisIE n=1 Tax=Bacillus sp. N1-1 TaxID=2682541 RepID=UPI001319208F|nr:bifunctional phosphoribosyl-AMP cyclohydrolase/phosphoribosyl-ATP diphosphatase HisIE [Bacillus sp. N1-1]QHA93359.1 bifunctional phosphoribosyl-AMP cyclohydrolase/phosphoribosyl-ATP diphosphatase HisIE [Bacillus sp. N1-1]
MNTEMIQFDEKGLVPAIVQDATSKEVLTLAYMNKESLTKTIETKETWFYSRSREELWHKGATSGNTQHVLDLRYDCDQDAVLVLVNPEGPACHKGTYSCFSDTLLSEEGKPNADRFAILNTLEQTIAKREAERPDGAYTTYLFNEGVDKILKKVGEEASEVIIAAKNRDHQELTWESADLIFHLMVLLREQECALDDVLQVLEERHASK